MSVYVDRELSDFIKSKKTVAEFQKGDVIVMQGEVFDRVYYLQSGFVKLYDIDEEGNERSISIFAEGSVFPITWLMKEPPSSYLYFYEALSDASCFVVDAKLIRGFVVKHPDSLLSTVDYLVRSYINLAARVQNLEKSRVSERLEFVLFQLAMLLGKPVGEISRIDTSITQEEIARLAGVTRESLSLEINQRQDDNRPYWRDQNSTYINLEALDNSGMPTVMPNEPPAEV